jgi:hypothetical protein
MSALSAAASQGSANSTGLLVPSMARAAPTNDSKTIKLKIVRKLANDGSKEARLNVIPTTNGAPNNNNISNASWVFHATFNTIASMTADTNVQISNIAADFFHRFIEYDSLYFTK